MGNEEDNCQGNDKGSDYQIFGRAAWLEAEGLLRLPQLLGGDCLPGGEKEWHLHHSRLVQDQDPHQASHEGRNQERLRQGDEGCRKARKEDCESLPSACSEAADLDPTLEGGKEITSRGSADVGIPQSELGRCSMTSHSGGEPCLVRVQDSSTG